jgi:membrane protein DedA with SNARE-associated domain
MLESWVSNYGYPAVLAGTFLEGETVMVLAGVAAHMGYLSLELVIACGFLGSMTGDQLFFYLGRHHGNGLLARHPDWQMRTRQVLQRLERYRIPLLLGFRFMYGLRSITPFAVGLSTISWLRFTLFNILGAGIWAAAIGLAGYYFGRALEAVIGDIRQYELEVMGGIIAAALLLWLAHRCHRQQRSSRRIT